MTHIRLTPCSQPLTRFRPAAGWLIRGLLLMTMPATLWAQSPPATSAPSPTPNAGHAAADYHHESALETAGPVPGVAGETAVHDDGRTLQADGPGRSHPEDDHEHAAASAGAVVGTATRPDNTPAGDDHAHDDHDETAAATTVDDADRPVPAGRPRWIWVVTLLLVGVAAASPAAGRRWGTHWPTVPVAAGCAVLAVALLGLTRPGTAAAPPGRASHDDEHAHDHEDSPFVEVDPEALAALGLRTEAVAPEAFSMGLSATGRIVPVEARQAHLGSRLAGRLTSVRVRIGERVAAGEVVATLDSVDAAQAAAAWREAAASLRSAERSLAARRELAASGTYTAGPLEEAQRALADARVAQAQVASELAQARNEAESATAEQARTGQLAASGSFTTATVEEARAKLAEAERALAEARSAVTAAEANESDAEEAIALARTRLAGAEALAARTGQLAATGELDRAPLEQARNARAAARAQLQQAEAALAQARQQATRGEQLYEAELVSLNDLESRRTALRERESQRDEAAVAVENAEAALARASQISEAKMASGRAGQEAQNTVAEARRELTAAEARRARAAASRQAVAGAVGPAEAAVSTARAALRREEALAADGTRSRSATDAAALRLVQAERLAAGKAGELAEAQRKVAVAQAALTREERLAASQVRAREQLLEYEREVRAARIARDNAAEILQLLGASPGAGHGPVAIPIRTPLAGVVTALEATVGEAVDASQTLVTIDDLSEVYLEADVYEKDLPVVQAGQLARVLVQAYPDEPFMGTVVGVNGPLDPETRAAHVRVRLDNPAWRLRPGMFATVAFETSHTATALSVPQTAVQEIGGQTVVFLQRAPDRFEQVPVITEAATGPRVVVRSGLQPGDVVVTEGSYLLKSERLKDELGEGHTH